MIGIKQSGFARALTVFALGSIAQGVPFAVVAVDVNRGDGSGRWVAAVALTRLAPYLLCSSVAGAIVARLSAQRVFALCGIARAATGLALWGALAADLSNIVLIGLLFVMVAFGTPTYPALMQVVHGVPMADRPRAAALAAGLESAAFWVGPALGGLLLATDTGGALPICVAAAALSTVFVGSQVDGRPVPDNNPSSALIRRAARCLVQRGTRGAVVSVLVVNVLIGLIGVLLVNLAGEFDGSRDETYGALTLVQGIGAAVAFLALVGPLRIHHRPQVPMAAATFAVGVLAVADRIPTAIVACTIFGAAALASEVVVSAAVSETLPASLVAPAIGLLDTGMIGAMLLGALAAPPLIDTMGVQGTLVIASAVATSIVLACTAHTYIMNGSTRADQEVRATTVHASAGVGSA